MYAGVWGAESRREAQSDIEETSICKCWFATEDNVHDANFAASDFEIFSTSLKSCQCSLTKY